MDPQFWLDRWQSKDIGFHMNRPHPLLEQHWGSLDVRPGSNVLVPLAGKSLDMVWLADRGHSVVGVELAAQAVREFFTERSRNPAVTLEGPFSVYRAGPFEIWQGDFFELSPVVTRRIGAVYDRAALVAMPGALQQRYVDQLARLTPTGVPVLLVALDYDPSEMNGPPFPIPERRIEELMQPWFRVRRLETRDGLLASPNLRQRGLSWLRETVYILTRNGRLDA
jgi:thiopurine S-methyltransferase